MYSVSKRLQSFGRWLVVSLLCLQLQHCPNAYRDFGDKSSDNYLIYETKRYMDKLDFDTALRNITPVLASQPKNEEVVYLASAVYAGRAGLRILNILSAIPGSIGSKGLLAIFAEHMPDMTATNLVDIQSAVDVLQNYEDDASKRGNSLNFYALFLYYARIGAIINHYGYDSSEKLLSRFSACTKSEVADPATTGIPDADLDKIMISFPRIIDTVGAVAGSGSSLSDVVNEDLSTALGGQVLPSTPFPCSTATGADAGLCTLMRGFINIGKPHGIGVGAPGNVPGQESDGTCQ